VYKSIERPEGKMKKRRPPATIPVMINRRQSRNKLCFVTTATRAIPPISSPSGCPVPAGLARTLVRK
jgi:hypothetical protein